MDYLPKHASIEQACAWLRVRTGETWTLPRLLESGLMPWFWLEYKPGAPDVFGDRLEGFLAPMIFAGDIQRLAADGTDLLATITRTPDGKLLRFDPGLRASLTEMRFQREEIANLAAKARQETGEVPAAPELPPGFIAVKKGGRPKREARDAAVFLAKIWRMDVHHETAAKAEKWIVDEWERHGTLASKGIGETANVRGSINRARSNGLNSSLLMIDHVSGLCSAVECRKTGDGSFVLEEGFRSWHWTEGLTEAMQGLVKNPTIARSRTVANKTPIAAAVESMLR